MQSKCVFNYSASHGKPGKAIISNIPRYNNYVMAIAGHLSDNNLRVFNPLYTGGLFYRFMLDESICHFRGAGSVLSLLFYV